MSTNPSGIKLESPIPLEASKVRATRSKFERLDEQERREAATNLQPLENRPKSRGPRSIIKADDPGRPDISHFRSHSRPSSGRYGSESLARASNSNPWRPPAPPDSWEEWLPERGGPKDLEVGIKSPPIRSRTPVAQMLNSSLGDLPDFVVHSRPQSAMSRRPTPSQLRRISMDASSVCRASDLISMGTDSSTTEVMRRLEQHQAQHVKPRLSRHPSVASPIPSLPPLPTIFNGPLLFSSSLPNSRPGSPVSALVLPDSRRKSSTEGSGSSVLGSTGSSSKISAVTTPDGYETPPSSVDAVLDNYPGKRDPLSSVTLRDRNQKSHSHPGRQKRHSVDLSGAPGDSPLPRRLSISVGGDAQLDFHHRSLPHRRPQMSNIHSNLPEAMRTLHGGVMPIIDLREVRPAIRKRPPVAGRNFGPYNKIINHPNPRASSTDPSPSNERQLQVAMSRRASYSSVTGISPIPNPPLRYHPPSQISGASTLPKTSGRRVLSLDTTHHPPQIDGNLNSALAVPTSPVGTMDSTPNSSVFIQSPPERKKVGDFGFVNTLESAERPYTPDEFAANIIANAQEANRTKGSSKKSVRSLASFISRYSDSEQTTNATTPLTTSSINMLRKDNLDSKPQRLSVTEYFSDAQDTVTLSTSKKPIDRRSTDIYITDLPVIPTAHIPPASKSDDTQPICSDSDEISRLKNRPSLFRLLDCTVAAPAVSGLSEEIARVSDQIHGTNSNKYATLTEPDGQPIDTNSKVEARSEGQASLQVTEPSASTSTAAESLSMIQFPGKHRRSTFSLGGMFRQGRMFLRESFNNGLGSAVQKLRTRRAEESHDKVSAYMAGALPSARSSRVKLGKGKKDKGTAGNSSAQLNPEEGSPSHFAKSSGTTTPGEVCSAPTSPSKSVSDLVNATAANIGHQKSAFTEDLKKSELKGVKSERSRKASHRGSVASIGWGKGSRKISNGVIGNSDTDG